MSKRDQADVADDAFVFLPDVAGERQGGGFGHAVGPGEEGAVAACAAHVLQVAPAFAVHGVGEALFDQVGHGGQVAQDVERAQVGVRLRFFSCWGGDGGHWLDYRWGLGNGEWGDW